MNLSRVKAAVFLNVPGRAWAWATYDFANTIFSMNIITMYLAPWVIIDLGFEDIAYSVAYATSMAAVGLTMPVIGTAADWKRNHLGFLFYYTVACVAFTAALGVVARAGFSVFWKGTLALVIFGFANYFYIGGQTFYNSLLVKVARPGEIGRVSGLGTALGYVGAIFGLLLVWPFVKGALPALGTGRPAAFIPTAFFFLVFALPTFIWVKPSGRNGNISPPPEQLQIRSALRRVRERPGVIKFLVGNFFLEDPVATAILFMAVYAEKVFGLRDDAKIPLFIVSTTCAVLGAAAAGHVTDRWGPKSTTVATAWGWAATFVFITLVSHRFLFWIAGGLVGVGLGFTWTAARPFLSGLVKADEQGEFFGLYALSSRAAAIVGPLLWGGVILAAGAWPVGKYRLAVASLAVMEILAAFMLRAVPWRENQQRAVTVL